MSNLQERMDNRSNSFTGRLKRWAKKVVAPHPSITEIKSRNQTELLNTTALTVSVFIAVGIFMAPGNLETFEFILGVAILSFLLGKSRYPTWGRYIFAMSLLSVPPVSLYMGLTKNYSFAFSASLPIALVIASAITNPFRFGIFVVYASLATFLAPLYSAIPIETNTSTQIGGVITSFAVILFGINLFREKVLHPAETQLEEKSLELGHLQAEFEKQSAIYQKELASTKKEAQEHTERLRVIAAISHEISMGIGKKTDELLTRITQTVSESFGFYHVGIFMLDKQRQYAELRAANSEGGQRMLARHHQLKIGGTGIVGYVSQSGYPRIALSTGADAVFFNNPDLPETNSEMALPLKYGNEVIGVLDVQSHHISAFSEEDVNVFTALANQIALVIQNNQSSEVGIGVLQKTTTQIGFAKNKDSQEGYSYLPDGTITSTQAVSTHLVKKAISLGETAVTHIINKDTKPALAVPVKVRDQIIGYIHIESAENDRRWSENEVALVESVSERAALALENARLFEETERRAEQEQVIAQVTSRIGDSNTFERVLQTTIQELRRTLGASRAFIQMSAPVSKNETEQAGMDKGI
jgi:GAF domain-containing protein